MIQMKKINMKGMRKLSITATAMVAAAVMALAGCGSSPDAGPTSQVARGERVFRRCTACHTIGQYAGDTDGPNLSASWAARSASGARASPTLPG